MVPVASAGAPRRLAGRTGDSFREHFPNHARHPERGRMTLRKKDATTKSFHQR